MFMPLLLLATLAVTTPSPPPDAPAEALRTGPPGAGVTVTGGTPSAKLLPPTVAGPGGATPTPSPVEEDRRLSRRSLEVLFGFVGELGLGAGVLELPLGYSGSDWSYPTAILLVPVAGLVGAVLGTWLGSLTYGEGGLNLPLAGAFLGFVAALVLFVPALLIVPLLALVVAAPVVGAVIDLNIQDHAREAVKPGVPLRTASGALVPVGRSFTAFTF